jgi:putative nucleotidyltransferase with HDIG domain
VKPTNKEYAPTTSKVSRDQIVQELPEIKKIRSSDLRNKVIDAWVLALRQSSFTSIRQIAPAGNPGVLEVKRGDQTDHIRGVTRLAVQIANQIGEQYPDLHIDHDVLIAGGLCHDIGKPWEFDPVNRKRWDKSRNRTGRPSIRHPAYGAHICLTVGLPEEVAHVAIGHSGEGELIQRSVENTIIHYADHVFWHALMAGDLIKPETIPDRKFR